MSPTGVKYTQQGAQWESTFEPYETKEFTVSYGAYGTEDFSYQLDQNERIGKLSIKLRVSGTDRKPELPSAQCLEPSAPLTQTADGWEAAWEYSNLLTTKNIVIVIPTRFMGGNVVQRVDKLTWAAVATVVLFGLVLFTGGLAAKKPVSVGQYLLIVLALVVFYPLFVYLSKYVPVMGAFWLSYAGVGALVLWNLKRGQGLRFALRYGGFGLVVLLGLFTAAALATKGAGVLVMVGLFLLVGFVMAVAPRVAAAIEESRPPLPPAPPPPAPRPPRGDEPDEDEGEEWDEEEEERPRAAAAVTLPPAPAPPVPSPQPQEIKTFCVYCGRAVAEGFVFCPHCGKGADNTVKCGRCGNAVCVEGATALRFCPGCGEELPRTG